jgi:hypothetical protein
LYYSIKAATHTSAPVSGYQRCKKRPGHSGPFFLE